MSRAVARRALVLVLLLLASSRVAMAASFVVDTNADAIDAMPGDGICAIAGGGCTLRAAIREANVLVGADTITLPAGTYVLAIPGVGEDLGATGDLDVSSDVTITGAGALTTVIDGNGIDRVIHTREPVTISGVTLRGGAVPGDCGGGVLNQLATLTLTDVIVTNNSAARGGGVCNEPNSFSHVIMTGVVVSQNSALGLGGGVLNRTWTTQPFPGQGTVSMTDCVIAENVAVDGGGVAAESNLFTPRIEMLRTTVRDNEAVGMGGGMYDRYFGSGTALHAAQTTLSGNVAAVGGGIHGGVWLEETTLSGNRSDGDGGGLYVPADFGCQIHGVTITANVADADADGTGDGGGVHLTAPHKCTIGSSILSGNQDTGGEGPDCAGGDLESEGYNVFGGAAGCLVAGDATGNVAGIAPKLGPLTANGGATLTHALLPGSPALDAGGGCSATDQRGVARPQGPACDIGAVEQEYVATNCGNGALDGGEVCDDGNVRDGDCCDHVCQLESAGSACSDGHPCSDDVCDGAGACVSTPNTAPCSDGSVCTPGAETCAAGSCVAASPLPCDDGNECTANSCDDVTGCFNPSQNGLPCDDGNGCTAPDQCLFGSCQGAPTNDPCDDGSVCTLGDHCDAGACIGSSTLSCGATCERCDAQDGCVFRPRDDCHEASPRKARVLIKDRDNDKADGLLWSYLTTGGPDFTAFNGPVEICVFDTTGGTPSLVYGAQPSDGLCGGEPCWSFRGHTYKYRDNTGSIAGVTNVQVTESGASRLRIKLQAKGTNVPGIGLPLSQDPRVIVELRRRTNACWRSQFSTAKKNDSASFSATSD